MSILTLGEADGGKSKSDQHQVGSLGRQDISLEKGRVQCQVKSILTLGKAGVEEQE